MIAHAEIVIDNVMVAHGAGAVIDPVLVQQFNLVSVDGVVAQAAAPIVDDEAEPKQKPAGKDKQRKAGKDKNAEVDPAEG